MKRNRFFALLFVLASIGITLVVVCWMFFGQFEGIYIENEEEKLQLYCSIICSDLNDMPEDSTDEHLADRARALFDTIEEQSELRCRLYKQEEDGLSVLYASDSAADPTAAYAYYHGQLDGGMYSGSESEYSDGYVKCGGSFVINGEPYGVVELQIGSDNLSRITRSIWRTVIIAFAVLCVLAISIGLIGRFTGQPTAPEALPEQPTSDSAEPETMMPEEDEQ